MNDALESRLAELFRVAAAKIAQGTSSGSGVAGGRYAFTVDGRRACALEIGGEAGACFVLFPYDGRWDALPFRGEVLLSRATLSGLLDGPLKPHVAFLKKLVRVEGDLPSVLALFQRIKS